THANATTRPPPPARPPAAPKQRSPVPARPKPTPAPKPAVSVTTPPANAKPSRHTTRPRSTPDAPSPTPNAPAPNAPKPSSTPNAPTVVPSPASSPRQPLSPATARLPPASEPGPQPLSPDDQAKPNPADGAKSECYDPHPTPPGWGQMKVQQWGQFGLTQPDGADDECDAGVVESAERFVEVDGDASSDAGCQPQDPVLPAAAGKEPGIVAADDGLPVDVGELGDAVGDRGDGADETAEVVAVQPSAADDQIAGCFERVEAGGAGADRQPADAGCHVGFPAQPGDLVMLGGEPGQSLVAEAGEFAGRGV